MKCCVERWAAWGLVLACITLGCSPAHAHKASDAYLQIQRSGEQLTVRWDIALRDLDAALDLDANEDRQLTWGEVRRRLPDIKAYALARLDIQHGQCPLNEAQPPALEDRVDGAYLVLQLRGACPQGSELAIGYHLFSEIDPTHRGLLRLESSGTSPVVRSLDPFSGPVSVAWPRSGATDASLDSGAAFFFDGIHHILIGYDHILFLVCLLLPSVLRRNARGWMPVLTWREAVWPMFGIVTMFTIAHSITLALAGLKVVTISPRIIEPGIALTIILAAADNFYPLLRGRRRLFAFLFGLIHGFGFAGALGELDLPVGSFVMALLKFNLGVEAGQLLVVATVLLALLMLRRWQRYSPVILQGGSAIAMMVALIWLGERVLDVKLLPFS
ncbi:MAG: HupE/UreJ family protein [Variovorax sp.]|uniref:HupE/UreJ family protein n=1 Tax=Variovorax paradoxus TaxID=34073 RepID=A0A2W5QHS3_VARPD|nr:HupE/UreJ family protein [Variovorax sp.]PZQ76748.1 MAG: hypothetical protein DI563_06185 [Variovorax paradoxus]